MMRHFLLFTGLLVSLTACDPKKADTVEPEKRLAATSVCDDGICLVVSSATQDSDGDGVTDDDERAAGTDPNDPASRPPTAKLLGLIGKGALPSFNNGFSEIVVLPAKAPDGTAVGPQDPLANGLSVPKRDGLAAAGISTDAIKKAGISLDSPFLIAVVKRTGTDTGSPGKPPPMKIGGIDIGLISQGIMNGGKYCGPEMNRCPDADPKPETPDGGTPDPGTGGGKPDPGTGGGGTDGGTGKEPSWWCKNIKIGCGLSGDDPAGNGIMVVEITADDLARVKAKLGSTKRPGPDTPSPVDGAEPIVESDPNGPIMLYDPESRAQQGLLLVKPKAGSDPSWNSNFGPKIVDVIISSSGIVPKTNPGPCPSGQPC
jgi:hypothetical protein